MAIKIRRDVPVKEIEDVGDAIGGIAKLYMIESQIKKDTKTYNLTDDEVIRLRDSYLFEDSDPDDRYVNTSLAKKARKWGNKPAWLSSDEILE